MAILILVNFMEDYQTYSFFNVASNQTFLDSGTGKTIAVKWNN